MKNYWMIALGLLVITAGCGPQESAERAAQDALQDQKVRAALTKQERGSMSMPAEVKPDTEAEEPDSDHDAEATKDTEPDNNKAQTPNSGQNEGSKPTKDSEAPAEPEPPAKDDATIEDTAAAPRVDAQEIFAAAVAAAKADDKALFVHFTADW